MTYPEDSDVNDIEAETSEVWEPSAMASASCCAGVVEPEYDWQPFEPEPSGYADTTGDVASTWTDPAPASAVIPAGQPGGPVAVGTVASDVDWQPQGAVTDLYPAVPTIGADHSAGPVFEPTVFEGPGSYGTPQTGPFGDGGGYFTGTGFSALATTTTDPIASWGTGSSTPTGPMFEPTSMTISTTPNPMAGVFAQAAQQGDVMTQIQVLRIAASEQRMAVFPSTYIWG